MAKTPRDRRKPAPRRVAPRRAATRLPADLVQPGAVGMTLATPAQLAQRDTDEADAEHEADEDSSAEARAAFMSLARQRFRMSADAESQLRRDMAEDMRFYNSEQWPDHILASRTLDNRVSLTINRLPQFVRQVVNQGRQSKPAIQVNPVDNGADPDTAEVFQGICRQIERQSKAHVAYAKASEDQAIMGRGWWRIVADYARDDSMEQEIQIKRVMDALTVYPDPSCSEPDNSDATFCFIVERLNKTVYQAKYGEDGKEVISATDFQSIGDDMPLWVSGDGVQVAEYFYVEHTKFRLAECLFTGVTPGQLPARITIDKAAIRPENLKPTETSATPAVVILKERDSVRKQVKWALINGVDVLDGNADKSAGRDLPGSYIPVVPVLGEELIVNGRRNIRGMVRDAQSPQRAYNFWISSITEKIALSTKAPVIAAVGQLEGLEEKWNNANHRNYPYLEYNPIDVNGTLVPAPQRAAYDPDISAALQMTMQADRDLKSVIGMFDASQERSPEQSGKAILARQRQGEEGTSHFLDNLARSIEHTGRILIEWIPVYYDTPRMLRINGLDDQPRQVLVHAGQQEAAHGMLDSMDEALRQDILSGRPFDLGVGRYDVTISTGPSYQSRRQESVDALIQLVQAYPNLLPVIGDILLENMDWPGARQLAARLKKMVPPQVLDDQNGDDPQVLKQQMSQLQQQLQVTMQALQEKDQIIQTKAQEMASKAQIAQTEIASKERLQAMKIQADRDTAMAKIQADKAMALLEARMQEINQRLEHAHELRTQALPPQKTVHPSESINYKDAPPDIRRQMEEAAGMEPSTADEESPNAPAPPPASVKPGAQPSA